MRQVTDIITTQQAVGMILTTLFASTGFFNFIIFWFQLKEKEKERKRFEEIESKRIKADDFENLCACVTGIAMFRITRECKRFIDRGYITLAELDSLEKHLFVPYKKLGGNSIAETMMEKVRRLPNKPLRKSFDEEEEERNIGD